MDQAQFESLKKYTPAVGPDDKGDRTLLFGYDVDRRTWHVYQQDGELHLLIYRGGISPVTGVLEQGQDALDWDLVESGLAWHAKADTFTANWIPNKRVYPEACDFDFCDRLQKAGFDLPWTTFNPDREPLQFHGLIASDIEPASAPAPGL